MSTCKGATSRKAFTMVELMVVIAVIALLVAILMPALSAVRTNARCAQANGQFSGLAAGIEAFRGESALGGRFPPSASDYADDHQLIANPRDDTGSPSAEMRIAGAHLLLQAMLGADLLGTPGFVDTDRDGYWSDDTNIAGGGDCTADYVGAYALDGTTTDACKARYGGAGYVDDKMRAQAKSLLQLQESGTIVTWNDQLDPATTGKQLLFVDPWDHPILYYRANRAARWMMGEGGSDGEPGIYQQEDNGIITGSNASGYASDGMDFGAGAKGDWYHSISVAAYPPRATNIVNGINDVLTDPAYEDSLARFILDPSVIARNTPVRKDSYLLISAGPDGRYGTTDDVTNWARDRE